jgi:Peptidase family M23
MRTPKIRRAEWGSPFLQRTVYSAVDATTPQEFFSQRVTFLIAIFTVLAFVMGNMVGTHGWHVFWSSVLGEQIPDSAITFDGTVAPVAQVPDLQKWGKLGGNTRDHTFREVPADLLIPLPPYSSAAVDQKAGSYYFVDYMGTYATGRGEGGHPGIDIAVPVGTPVQSIAAGVVIKSEQDSGGFGKFVTIRHPNVPDPTAPGAKVTIYSTYAHLSAQLVQPGMVVRKGEQIGLSGMSGFASGPHLHFQIERDTAPFHPYWLFSGKEARDAGMDFTQAVNAGLHRERGLQYTLNPMVFVQANQKGYTVVSNTEARTATTSSRSASSVLTAADRRNVRLSRQSSSTVVALARSSSSSSVSPVVVASTAATVASGIGTITVRHDGEITSVGQRETLRLEVVGSDGETVQKPKFDKPIELRTAFGQAKFTPARITAADFRNGQAQVTMEALSPQTIVVQLQPSGVMSAPIRFIR